MFLHLTHDFCITVVLGSVKSVWNCSLDLLLGNDFFNFQKRLSKVSRLVCTLTVSLSLISLLFLLFTNGRIIDLTVRSTHKYFDLMFVLTLVHRNTFVIELIVDLPAAGSKHQKPQTKFILFFWEDLKYVIKASRHY